MKRLLPVLLLVGGLAVAQAGEVVRMASEARLWLKVPKDQPPLGPVRVSAGRLSPVTWEKDAAVRERWADVLFPVTWWSWAELSVSFTAVRDTDVEVSLLGPWAADQDGVMPRQEVLWDQIRAEGVDLSNGGFETMGERVPEGWKSPWAEYPKPDAWPLKNSTALEGKSVAAAWCKRPLSQVIHAKGGKTVTLRFHAKAATPPDFDAPKAFGAKTPAHRAVASLKRGVNLGNGWEAPPSATWRARFTIDDIDRIAAEGFDHVRVPVAWHYYLKSTDHGLEIDTAMLAELEPVLRHAMEKHLVVMINWHHFNDLTAAPGMHADRFASGWDAIARHFKSWPSGLFFELLNEPCDKLTTAVANPIYQNVIGVIRKTNPERILVVSPGSWGSISELDQLRLPDDDRIVVTVHSYAPFQFTHQGAGWVGFQSLRGIVYPGPPAAPFRLPETLRAKADLAAFVENYNTLEGEQNPCSKRPVREMLDMARAWSQHFGRPVHLGEFGAHEVGDGASRARYLHDVRTLAEERHIPWTVWEWKSSFGYWDPVKNRPRFRASLFE